MRKSETGIVADDAEALRRIVELETVTGICLALAGGQSSGRYVDGRYVRESVPKIVGNPSGRGRGLTGDQRTAVIRQILSEHIQ